MIGAVHVSAFCGIVQMRTELLSLTLCAVGITVSVHNPKLASVLCLFLRLDLQGLCVRFYREGTCPCR
jgi:hypothetical protein